MKFLCIKYSGLKFSYIFETNDFIFIPKDKLEEEDVDFFNYKEIFKCRYEKDSSFYVLLKEFGDFNLTIKDFSEKELYQFKLLEALLNLLFSNFLRREYIFILEKDDSQYVVKKIFKNLSKEIAESNQILLWKDSIIINFLQEILNLGFSKFNSVNHKEYFALRYSFCVAMYLQGKFGENKLRIISDLWISLEILSFITISSILHSHELFKVKDSFFRKEFFKKLKKKVEKYSSKISEKKIDCWLEMKNTFPKHMKNKINYFLPIFQKCVKVAEEYLDVDDIKVKLKQEDEFNDIANYQQYLNNIREFKEYQDGITIKNIISKFFENRNKLFHGGKIDERWSLKSDRIKANFIKILEQLFFKILDLNMIYFYQMGYPHQRIFGIPNEDNEPIDLGNLFNRIGRYILENHIMPLKKDFKDQFDDVKIVKENYINNKSEFDLLRIQLNSSIDKVLAFLNDTHSIQFLVEEKIFNHSLNYQEIKERILKFTFEFPSGMLGEIYDKKRIMIKNHDNTNIISRFVGMFDDDAIRYGVSFTAPFLINPPYICFDFI